MKKLFEIDSDEIKRILSLHENSTKKQYLNLINEIGAGGEGDTTFDPAQYDYSNVVKTETPTKQFNGLNYTLQNDQTFIGAVGGKKINVPAQTIVTVDQTNKKLNIGKYFKFGCQPITVSQTPFYYTSYDGKRSYGNQGSALTNILRKRYCKGTELKSNEEILGKNKTVQQKPKVGGSPKVGGGQVTLNPQQMTDTIKQVQQSVGIQNPTGQITDTDVDALIAKLSEN